MLSCCNAIHVCLGLLCGRSHDKHDWSADEEVYVKYDFMAKAHSTRMLEQELEEMKARLAKLEGK